MKGLLPIGAMILWTAVGWADEPTTPLPPAPSQAPGSAAAKMAAPPASTVRPRGVAPGLAVAQESLASPVQSSGEASGGAVPAAATATFTAEEKWGLAGYNNNEPIYTILVTSHDARIIRCTADLKGTYIENGEKLGITDRQTMTVFPNQQVQIGNWSGMDQQSGATYAVKCRPI